MNSACKAALFGGALFYAGIANAKDTYRIYGPSSNATTTGYSLDSAAMAGFVASITNPDNFSHFQSVVDTSVEIGTWSSLDINERAYAECLISPWMVESDFTAYEVATARNIFRDGGDLLLFNDDNYHDTIGESLGIPTYNYASTNDFNGTAFPFDGPFGTTSNVDTSGYVGFLLASDVLGTGGQVLALNAAGQITAAFWDDNAYGPGYGRMIIVTDVNTITNQATYAPLNDNGRFALNLVAGLIGLDMCNPADTNGDGILNFDDIDAFVNNFLGGCP